MRDYLQDPDIRPLSHGGVAGIQDDILGSRP